ncbi:MAG: hypothetical protein NDI77_02185 [Geobacteraceae bacterium]|nr:hypothetical protein [Geobacteraceae bacterium]
MVRILVGQLSALLVILSATQGCAMGVKQSELTTLTGTVRVVGNEPFARLVLTTGSNRGGVGRGGNYLLLGPLQDELRRAHQGSMVTLEGKQCSSPTPEFTDCFEPSRIIEK